MLCNDLRLRWLSDLRYALKRDESMNKHFLWGLEHPNINHCVWKKVGIFLPVYLYSTLMIWSVGHAERAPAFGRLKFPDYLLRKFLWATRFHKFQFPSAKEVNIICFGDIRITFHRRIYQKFLTVVECLGNKRPLWKTFSKHIGRNSLNANTTYSNALSHPRTSSIIHNFSIG